MMPTFFVACAIGAMAVFIGLSVRLLIRNARVYRYRSALIDAVGDAGHRRLIAGDAEGAFRMMAALDAVPYERMVAGWKPLEDYYAGTYIEPEALIVAADLERHAASRQQ